MNKKTIVIAAITIISVSAVYSAEQDAAEAALIKGLDFLMSKQETDGHFSDAKTPALTALPLWASAECAKKGIKSSKYDEAEIAAKRENAAKFVLAAQNEDGGFYAKMMPRPPKDGKKPPKDMNGSGGPGGLSTYNTAVCLSALFEFGKAPTEPLLKARKFLAESQLDGDDTMAGGFGYGQTRGPRRYADLSNTAYALDAMRRTEGLEEFRKDGKKVDVNWDKAIAFVENLQEKEGPAKGGAAYNERTAQAGTATNATGRVKLMAYGSMSYAAVMSMAHAKLSKGDPRVRNAMAYCEKYWTVEENPGMGTQGLFYYYDILSRALSAAAVDKVGDHEWKKELAAQLVKLQKPDGSWYNENNRFWEADPVLCTSFAVICLSLCR